MNDISSTITTARNVMSDEEFDRRYAELRRTYGDSTREAGVRREQELARFFYVSGKTQENIAERTGVFRTTVGRRILFGQFLDFEPAGSKSNSALKTLNERRFRELWQQTEAAGKNDRQRFRAVLDLLAQDATLAKARSGKVDLSRSILDDHSHFADGKWHDATALAEALGEAKDIADAALEKLGTHKTYKCKLETKPAGTSYKFRIFRQHDPVSIIELVEELSPIIEDLKNLGKRDRARYSPAQITEAAGRLQKLLDKWRA